MFWYGPAGIGSNYTYPGFDVDHRIPFLTAFPDRRGAIIFVVLAMEIMLLLVVGLHENDT